MVENKTNWNLVLVVLVVGVIGILLLNNSGILTGRLLSGSYMVVANSCNADATCEIKKADIGAGKLILWDTGFIQTGASVPLLLDSGTGQVVISSNDNLRVDGLIQGSEGPLKTKDDLVVANRLFLRKEGWIVTDVSIPLLLDSGTDQVVITDDLRVDRLIGTGNAYACINSAGVFYRSPTACV